MFPFKHIILKCSLLVYLSSYSSAQDVCSSKYQIITDLTPEECPPGKYYFVPNRESNNLCFPKCYDVYETIPCSATVKPCMPGYNCVNKKCEIDETSCFKYYYYIKDETPWYKSIYKPQCELDGTYKAKQCKGEPANGRCFCYDKIGNRIFGEAWSDKADDMTCACSRRMTELLKDPTRTYVSLHCARNGNFEELQCDSGLCWCVEPKTGNLVSKVVPENVLNLLPCYIENIIGQQYLRQCDSVAYAKSVVRKKFQIHGTQFPNVVNINCDWDGAYGKFQVDSNGVKCTWRDNSPIESFQANLDDVINVNCNCARDKKYFDELGKELAIMCSSNGNYPYYYKTALDGKYVYYCIDKDGFKKHDKYLDAMPTEADCANYGSF